MHVHRSKFASDVGTVPPASTGLLVLLEVTDVDMLVLLEVTDVDMDDAGRVAVLDIDVPATVVLGGANVLVPLTAGVLPCALVLDVEPPLEDWTTLLATFEAPISPFLGESPGSAAHATAREIHVTTADDQRTERRRVTLRRF